MLYNRVETLQILRVSSIVVGNGSSGSMQTIESALLNRFVHVACLFIYSIVKYENRSVYSAVEFLCYFVYLFCCCCFCSHSFTLLSPSQKFYFKMCNATRQKKSVNKCVFWCMWMKKKKTKQFFWTLFWNFHLIREWNPNRKFVVERFSGHKNNDPTYIIRHKVVEQLMHVNSRCNTRAFFCYAPLLL